MERRLAAILVADVVGYSRLMQVDEAGTLAALKVQRTDILQPLLTKHRGRIVKLMGDGVLVEFGSAVNAVQCAVELQQAMDTANAELPEVRRIVLRIGVNLGDVMVEGQDLYGDGVNVAARLETLAEPGSVVISETVFGQVRGKVQLGFDDLGEHTLKNIAETVRCYRVSAGGPETMPTRARITQSSKPSIAVLPFTNMSGDPEQEYFSDGIAEDIITDLSQVSGLFVVARNTAFTLKGKAVEIVQAARNLNVKYVVEGSVRKAGDRVRITVQLIDGDTGGHLWAERYDRQMGDIFALQDEITKSVVTALRVKLLPGELKSITTRSTTNPEAYEAYLLGRAIFIRGWGDRDAIKSARQAFGKAVQIDPGYSRAYAGIADCDASLWVAGDIAVSYDTILANSDKALELTPGLAEAHASRGFALYLAGHFEQAVKALDQAIESDPELFEAHWFYGESCRDSGRFEKAAILFKRALELLPTDYTSLTLLADTYESLGLREQSLTAARLSLTRIEAELQRRPDNPLAYSWGAGTLVYLGETEFAKAEEWANRSIALRPDDYVVRYNAGCAFAVIGKHDTALEHVEYIFSHVLRARRWLFGIISHDSQWKSLRTQPAFQEFMMRLEASLAGE